jgi:hypothetical protein
MITNILINSSTSRIYTDGLNKNLYFNIDVPPIEINSSAILKVSNFCHTGTSTGHTENIYIFKIRGVNVNNSKFLYNIDGNPVILATTLNNNRSLYEENELTLTKQTINNIDIIVDTLIPDGILTSVYITNAGSSYLAGQIINFSGGGSSTGSFIVSSVNSGVITSINNIIASSSTTYPIPSLTLGNINGSDAILVAVLTSQSISSITITSGGVGYKVGQSLNITGGGGSGANITIATVSALGAILTFTITSGGSSFTSVPNVSVNSTTMTHTATIEAIMKFGTITNGIPNLLNFCLSLRIEEDEDE